MMMDYVVLLEADVPPTTTYETWAEAKERCNTLLELVKDGVEVKLINVSAQSCITYVKVAGKVIQYK